jgi:hypothetical protein
VQGIFITTVLRNESDKPQKVNTKADFTRFDSTGMTSRWHILGGCDQSRTQVRLRGWPR